MKKTKEGMLNTKSEQVFEAYNRKEQNQSNLFSGIKDKMDKLGSEKKSKFSDSLQVGHEFTLTIMKLTKEDNIMSTGYKYQIEKAFNTQFMSQHPVKLHLSFPHPTLPILSIYEQKFTNFKPLDNYGNILMPQSTDITADKNLCVIKNLTQQNLKSEEIESRWYFLRILQDGFGTKILRAGLNEQGVDLCAMNCVLNSCQNEGISHFTASSFENPDHRKNAQKQELCLFKVGRNGEMIIVRSQTTLSDSHPK